MFCSTASSIYSVVCPLVFFLLVSIISLSLLLYHPILSPYLVNKQQTFTDVIISKNNFNLVDASIVLSVMKSRIVHRKTKMLLYKPMIRSANIIARFEIRIYGPVNENSKWRIGEMMN